MKKIFVLNLLVFIFIYLGYTQINDSVFHLQDIEVSAEREKYFSDDHKTLQADSFLLKNVKFSELAEIIDWNLPVTIRRYGNLGALANITMRGNSTSQIQINWNGFPINSVAIGTANLSNLFTTQNSEITVHWGTSGSLFGSALGAINVENSADWNLDKNYSIYSEFGSFNNQKYGLNFRVGNKQIQYKINASLHKSDGDFKFTDLDGAPKKRENNALNEKTLNQFLFIRLPRKNAIDIGFSYLYKNLSLPNSLLFNVSPSKQSQKDKESRIFVKWKKNYNKATLFVKSAYFSTFLKYENPNINYSSETRTQQYFADMSYRFYFSPIVTLDFATKYSYQSAEVNDYNSKPKEHNFSTLIASKFNFNNIVLNISGRFDIYDKENPNPQFSLGGKYDIIPKRLQLKANFSNQYRLPTFNDKYWTPGGNENLLPEKAYNVSSGLKYIAINKSKTKLTTEIDFFQTKTTNYILWKAVVGESYFAPVNIGKVNNKGWELSIKYRQKFSSAVQLFSHLHYHYLYPKDELTGKLLDYIPKHEAKSYTRIQYKSFYLINSIRYRDEVTTSDFTDNLEDYFIWDLLAGNKFNFFKKSMELTMNVSNITNTEYQQILGYPLPLRNFRIGLALNL